MKVILTETIDALGIVGTEVVVKDGYARNYLLPKKLAVAATASNRKFLEAKRIKWEKKAAEQKALAEQLASRLAEVSLTIEAKVSEEDRLYGSVSRKDILELLAEKGFELDKNMILLDEHIKTLGTYEVPIRVYSGVKPVITVEVVAEA